MKRIALPLAVALMPMLASAQPYTEDLPLIKGAKGVPMLCTRSDSATYSTSAVGDASFCAVNSVGAMQVNIDSTFQSGTSLVRVEDAAHSSGQPGIMALGINNETQGTQQNTTNGDYTTFGVDRYGIMMTAPMQFGATAGSFLLGAVRSEDGAIADGQALMLSGTLRQDTLTTDTSATADAQPLKTTSAGSLWATLTPSTTGGWSPYKASALTNSAVTVKASAGNLGGYHCLNAAAAITYIQIFDTSGAVTLGTTTPVLSFGLPASGAGNLEFSNGVNFANAIKVAATTTAGGSTAPATAMDCNFLYK